jgi:UDP-2,4-diacetamido-2,4,6-trideoxy-beta-L-altropyranose hydrolase
VKLLLCAEGSPSIGFGHVMRSVTIGLAAVRRGADVAVIPGPDPHAVALVSRRGLSIAENGILATIGPGDIVVFDGYGFREQDTAHARDRGARVAVIDDFGHGRYDVDVVLNQNLVLDHAYELADQTTLLLGPAYALVREEFRERRRDRSPGTSRLLITMGAADPRRAGAAALAALRGTVPFERVTLLVGPAAADPIHLPSWADVIRDPLDVAAVADTADAAVVAAGSTTWELLCLGLPIVLVQTADNQRHVAGPVSDAGAALHGGTIDSMAGSLPLAVASLARPDVQERLSRAALDMVDGAGADRFLDVLGI